MGYVTEMKTKKGTRYKARYIGTDNRTHNKTFDSPERAELWLAIVAADTARGTWVDERSGRIPLKAWVDIWWPTQVNLRSSTRERDESYMRNYVLPRFGHFDLVDVRQPDVQRWIADLSTDFAPATVHRAYQLLCKVLRSAKAAGKIGTLPLDEINLPSIELVEMKIIEPDQIERLASAIPRRYRAFVLLGSYSGLRLGELAGLKRARIDFLKRRVAVVEQLIEIKGRFEITTPKTRAGRRSVPVPPPVMDELALHCAEFDIGDDDFLFAGPHGAPLRKSNFRTRVWTPATVTAQLPEGFRIHDMRHTAVSLWIQDGANQKEVAVWAGHRSIATVYDRYGHLFPDQGDELMKKLAARIPSPGTATSAQDGDVLPLRAQKAAD